MPAKLKRLTWDDLPEAGLLLVLGHPGTGKTATAWWLAERLHTERKRPILGYGLPDSAYRRLPRWVKKAATVADIARAQPSVIVADEAAFSVNARRAMSADNVEWMKLAAVARHKDHLCLFICQESHQLDVALVRAAKLVLFKQPSILDVRGARPELRPEVQAAFEAFAKARGDKRQYVFAADYLEGRTGWLESGLPRFWSERLSKSFAAVDLDGRAA